MAMKTVSIIAQKGGSGKTTLCRHLAVGAQQVGLSTVIIDTDPQGGARDWGEIRGRSPDVVSELSPNPTYLEKAIRRCEASGVEILFVDTPGHNNPISVNAAGFSDLVLVPVRPTPDDLNALWQTIKTLMDRKVPYFAVLSQCPTTTRRPRLEALAALAKNRVPVCEIVIHQKGVVPASAVTGETALEMDGLTESEAKTVEEFQGLVMWLCDRLGLPVREQYRNKTTTQHGKEVIKQ